MKIDILQDNGWKTIDFPDGEQLPGIRNSCTIVPISVVLRELGFKVAWNGGTLSIKQDNKIVRIYEKRSYFEMIETIDGESDHIRYDHTDKKEIDSPVVGGRLLTPIRDVLESLCYIVLWDDASKTVKIIPPADNKITVRFNYNYGIEKSSDKPYFKRVSEGEAVTLPIPSRTGFVFDGWHIGRTDGTWVGDGKKSPTYYPAKSVTLYAYWGRKYNITLVTNGGTVASQLLRVDIGQSVQLPIPDRAGYKFEGWFLNSDFQGEPVNADDYHPTDHVTLYAKWRQLTATELMDNLERDNTYKTKYGNLLSSDKWFTLISIGRTLASNNYAPAFIAGFLGHITFEGNIGALYGQLRNSLNMTIDEIKTNVANNKAFGCCQWKAGRAVKLLEFYDQYHSGNDAEYYSLEEATVAEQSMLLFELIESYNNPIGGGIFNYTFVHTDWIRCCNGENVSEDSERAAYLAGYRILLGYGLSISISSGKRPKDEEEADAIRRGNCAADVYKAMIDPVT